MEPIFIVGAGGIGCAVGYTLCAPHAPVVFVDSNPVKVQWGQDHGVSVDSKKPLRAGFTPFDDWQPPEGATVILTTKCYDNARVLERLRPGVRLMPIQNGFDSRLEDRFAGCEGIASFVS